MKPSTDLTCNILTVLANALASGDTDETVASLVLSEVGDYCTKLFTEGILTGVGMVTPLEAMKKEFLRQKVAKEFPGPDLELMRTYFQSAKLRTTH